MKNFILALIVFGVSLTGYWWNGYTWIPNDSVLTEFGRMPKCTQTKIVKLENGTYYQADPCIQDPWGNNYAPWSNSGDGE